ncbi:hypothetical protein [Fluviispira multicolorata]|uniref:USP domain-containing protein n=1 Tax=Fluviispira multicolorata TaxID=2654512 RepID=A0A833N2T5_9BACT|nr:hypothetical protein [Fluviispira multicolorata]KAB8033278.1 hypothetical protein GCL57_00860 [Fluviispira multicolorata]
MMKLNILTHSLLFSLLFLIGCSNSNQKNNTEQPAGISNSESNKIYLSEALGTVNLGNTCFANSVHKLIWEYLRNHKVNPSIKKNTDVQKSFYDFMAIMNRKNDLLNTNPSQVTFENAKDPFYEYQLNTLFENIKNELKSQGGDGTISGYSLKKDQMDADEYFVKLIDLLDLNSVLPSLTISTQIVLKSGRKLPAQAESTKKDGSPNDIFYFRINIQNKLHSFDQLLLNNLTTEIDDFRVEGVPHNITKNTYFTLKDMNKIPDKFVFGLKRFTHDLNGKLSKNNDNISLSKNINIDFFSMNLSEKTSVSYELNGVVVHYGNGLNGGHYVAYIMADNNNWYKHNDTHISLIETDYEQLEMKNDIENNGYLFLFSKINN